MQCFLIFPPFPLIHVYIRDLTPSTMIARKAVVSGVFRDKHFSKLSDNCALMTCQQAGANTDVFTLLMRIANISVTVIPNFNGTMNYVGQMFRNESVDLSWTLQRNDRNRAERYGTRMTLPLTQVGYGYTAMEDRTEKRDAMITSFFYNPTLVCGVSLFIFLPFLQYFLRRIQKRLNVHRDYSEICGITTVFSFLIFGNLVQSWLTSILSSTDVVGFSVFNFAQLVDSMDKNGWKALTYPNFPLDVYCKENECDRFNEMTDRQMFLKDDEYYDWMHTSGSGSNIGFDTIGQEFLFNDNNLRTVVVFYPRRHILFAADDRLSMLPYSFHVAKNRLDLLEQMNRAIAMVYPAYTTIMYRYKSRFLEYRSDTRGKVKALSLDQLSQIFILWAVLISAAGIILLIEWLIHLMKPTRLLNKDIS